MDATRFDCLTRAFSIVLTRRRVASALGMVATGVHGLAAAKNTNTKRKLKKNAFGCVNVGKACRGKDRNCCSGICEGKKPKKGKQDKSRCVAHDTGGCQVADDSCAAEGVVPCSDGAGAICYRTTGKAGFCGFSFIGQCANCARDADCEQAFGPGAACVICAGGCAETNNRSCIPSGV